MSFWVWLLSLRTMLSMLICVVVDHCFVGFVGPFTFTTSSCVTEPSLDPGLWTQDCAFPRLSLGTSSCESHGKVCGHHPRPPENPR